jgi:hypothetical protein
MLLVSRACSIAFTTPFNFHVSQACKTYTLDRFHSLYLYRMFYRSGWLVGDAAWSCGFRAHDYFLLVVQPGVVSYCDSATRRLLGKEPSSVRISGHFGVSMLASNPKDR